jgi:hypothetical protein
MCARDSRGWAWIRNLTRRDEGDWPRLVWQDFIGLCALGALLAALVALAAGG